MRKSLFSIALVLLSVILIAGCSTSVRISYMKPSEINMSAYRNLAIASTVPYNGRLSYNNYIPFMNPFASWISIASSYNNNLPKEVADYATNQLLSDLGGSNYYNILSPSQTDAIINNGTLIGNSISKSLSDKGYDAVIIPRITNMSVNEYIWAVPEGYDYFDPGPYGMNNPDFYSLYNDVYGIGGWGYTGGMSYGGVYYPSFTPGGIWGGIDFDYYVHRDVSITYTLTVIDTKNNQIIATKTYSDSAKWVDDFNPYYPSLGHDIKYMFRSMINGFNSKIKDAFLPSTVTTSLNFMKNSPKIKSLDEAYKSAEKGNLSYALSLFLDAWKTDKHVPSGYNASLIYAATGEMKKAIELSEEVYRASGNPDVGRLYNRLQTMEAQTEAAENQINGTQAPPAISQSNQNSLYDSLLN